MPYLISDIFKGNFPISQYFGANRAYYSRFGLAGHEGVDWATPYGTPLQAPFNNNIIINTGWDGAYGYYMVIWDNVQKCAVWHCHMSRIYYSPGQRVAKGTVVGLTGSSGNVTGPHLHENFVETDAYANRLNRNNGYQGFRNILNGYLVKWVLYGLSKLGITKKPKESFKKVNSKIKERSLTPEEVMVKDFKEQKSVFRKAPKK